MGRNKWQTQIFHYQNEFKQGDGHLMRIQGVIVCHQLRVTLYWIKNLHSEKLLTVEFDDEVGRKSEMK